MAFSPFAPRTAATWGLSHQCSHGMGSGGLWPEGGRNHSLRQGSEKEARQFLLLKDGKGNRIELKKKKNREGRNGTGGFSRV